MVDPKEARASVAADNAGVHAKNTVNVAMEDLNEDDMKKMEQELEREMAELQRRKQACF
jgi:prefoldin subunit 5